MSSTFDVIFYILMFLSVYVQVFLLLTFFENRKKILKTEYDDFELGSYPSVSVIVPCFNEEKSIEKTIKSLLGLDYPKDKIKIIVVDDGSKDNTWGIIRQFENTPNLKIFHKENGGKYTALNLGLEHVDTEFFSCLDADSTVEPMAMKKIMKYFANDINTMAVIPSALVTTPVNIVQRAQRAEYNMAVLNKKIFSLLGGLHVTPGTLPVYRKRVVELIGGFRHGHNGEDMEMAFRMQKNHLKIVQCREAVVHTIPPDSVKALYKQRVRWLSAFLKNVFDYRNMIFRKKYGNFAWLTLPSGIITPITIIFVFSFGLYNIFSFIIKNIIKINVIGFESYFRPSSFDSFFINMNGVMIMSIFSYILLVVTLLIGNRLAEGKTRMSVNLLYFIGIYSVVAPFWLMKSVYNVAFSRKTLWR